MNLYDNYYFGMNLLWWFAWCVLIFWIFAMPYNIPGQPNQRGSAVDIVRKRFKTGTITKNEYDEKLRLIENDKAYYIHQELP
jgi:putative membrane protein